MTLAICMPYYDNPGMFQIQMGGWAEWPDELKRQVEIVIVDDGSPRWPAAEVPRPEGLPKLSIYRIAEDKPWHQHAARNLAADRATAPWLLLTDMDHVLPPDSAAVLLKRIAADKLDRRTVYMLDRVEADTGNPTRAENGKPKPHPNSFVMTRELYWKIGGYDEDLTGIYGTDSAFRARAFTKGKRGHLYGIKLRRYWRDLVPDASTTTLPRKEGRSAGAKQAILAAKAARGEANVVKTLQFEWEQVL